MEEEEKKIEDFSSDLDVWEEKQRERERASFIAFD